MRTEEQKLIESLESKIKEVQKELDAAKERLNKKEDDLTWEKSFSGEGYIIGPTSETREFSKHWAIVNANKRTATTEKVCKAMLAMAQLSHIIKKANGDWESNWKDSTRIKQNIYREGDKIKIRDIVLNYEFLTFRTENIAQKVLKQNERLIRDFYMMD